MKKKLPKKQLAVLQAARLKWISLSKADKFWRSLSDLFDVSPEHRAAALDRLREYAAQKPERKPVVESLAKALR